MDATMTHRLSCLAVETATDNLRDEGRIFPDQHKSFAASAAEDLLVQDTAAGYIEAQMTICTCR